MTITIEARCPKCGHGRAQLGPGAGPHAARWACEKCGRFIAWVSKRLLSDLTAGDLTDAMSEWSPKQCACGAQFAGDGDHCSSCRQHADRRGEILA